MAYDNPKVDSFPSYVDETGYVQLINGDSAEVLNSFEKESVDLGITSPPFWNAVEYESDNKQR